MAIEEKAAAQLPADGQRQRQDVHSDPEGQVSRFVDYAEMIGPLPEEVRDLYDKMVELARKHGWPSVLLSRHNMKRALLGWTYGRTKLWTDNQAANQFLALHKPKSESTPTALTVVKERFGLREES